MKWLALIEAALEFFVVIAVLLVLGALVITGVQFVSRLLAGT